MEKVNILNKFLIHLYPDLMLPQNLRNNWIQSSNGGLWKGRVAYLLLMSIALILHHFYIDIPLNKQPANFWLTYRFGCSALFLITAAIMLFFRQNKIILQTLLYLVCIFAFSLFQAKAMEMRHDISFIWIAVLPILAIFAGFESILISFSVFTGIIVSSSFFLASRPQDFVNFISLFIMSYISILIVKGKYKLKVEAYINDALFKEEQILKIQMEKELRSQVKAFLPKVVYNRILNEHGKNSSIENFHKAIDDQMQLKETNACILVFDVRKFTSQIKSNKEEFLNKLLIPRMKFSSEVIDENLGISRQVGDQIFAFFDDENPHLNLKRALTSAKEICDHFTLKNEMDGILEKNIIITTGQAKVGNVGGSDSNREITVHGNVANLPSRIDEITKNKSIKDLLGEKDIIVCPNTFKLLQSTHSKLLGNIKQISFQTGDISIRDFPEIRDLYFFNSSYVSDQSIDITDSLVNEGITSHTFKRAS